MPPSDVMSAASRVVMTARQRGPSTSNASAWVRFPHVVEHEQDGLVLQQLVELSLALRLVIEMAGIAEGLRDAALEGHERRLLADADPEHAVGKRPAHLVVARECGGQDRLADPAHAVNTRARAVPVMTTGR